MLLLLTIKMTNEKVYFIYLFFAAAFDYFAIQTYLTRNNPVKSTLNIKSYIKSIFWGIMFFMLSNRI